MYRQLGSDNFHLSKETVGEWPNSTIEVFLTVKGETVSFNAGRWNEFYDMIQAANEMIFNNKS